jgi:hypothetical protein
VGVRPSRLISDEDIEFIVATAKPRPGKLEQPFTQWSVHKLAAYIAENPDRPVRIGHERLRHDRCD